MCSLSGKSRVLAAEESRFTLFLLYLERNFAFRQKKTFSLAILSANPLPYKVKLRYYELITDQSTRSALTEVENLIISIDQMQKWPPLSLC